eukprot:scaffold334581_cov15-Prasinocladus_malaysianus.AAC.1
MVRPTLLAFAVRNIPNEFLRWAVAPEDFTLALILSWEQCDKEWNCNGIYPHFFQTNALIVSDCMQRQHNSSSEAIER